MHAFALLGLLACGGQRALPLPARFDRPNRVDFVCVRTGADAQPVPVQLSTCRGDTELDNGIALHALVTQSARGEVAAVNLETRTVIDNRPDIPGFTFVPVGDLPTGVVVAPHHPALTYVAEFGSADVRVLTTSLLIGPLTGSPEEQVVKLSIDTGSGPMTARPTDMLLAPEEDALLLPIKELGRVLWLPLQRCDGSDPACRDGLIDEAGIASIDLAGSAARVIAPTPSPPSGPYQKLCGFERSEPPATMPLAPPDTATLMLTPRPAALAIDANCRGEVDCHPRLLVADEALPLIHSIDLDAIEPGSTGSDALLEPLLTGVATKDVAVTPRVPVSVGSQEETQYVYAIDANDGSVLVLENGQVLNVNSDPAARPDRIELAGAGTMSLAAERLAVLTPDFDATRNGDQRVSPLADASATAAADEALCIDETHPTETPSRLRGVFLAAALSDGTIGIVDIHDMELSTLDSADKDTSCRTCAPPQPPLPGIPVLVRHHPRLAVNFITSDTVIAPAFAPASAPSFSVSGAFFPIRADGTHGSPSAPSLACIQCESDLVQTFPPLSEVGSDETGLTPECMDKPAYVCGSADPWNADNETWRASFEGRIPGTLDVAALAATTSAEFNYTSVSTRVDMCDAGVLGSEEIEPEYEASGCSGGTPTGDQLVVLERLATTPDARMYAGLNAKQRQACADAGKAIEATPTLAIAFEIRRAFRDQLVIRTNKLAHDITPDFADYAAVLRCLGSGPINFEVRTWKSSTVTGVHAGFPHRVKTEPDGRCVFDPDADPLLRGRAWAGCAFRNRTIAFALQTLEEDKLLPFATLVIGNQTSAVKLVLNANASSYTNLSVVPVQLRYNAVDQRLYLVDISDRGLMPIPVNPFPPSVDPSQSFN
jgi:hypothetical protein